MSCDISHNALGNSINRLKYPLYNYIYIIISFTTHLYLFHTNIKRYTLII